MSMAMTLHVRTFSLNYPLCATSSSTRKLYLSAVAKYSMVSIVRGSKSHCQSRQKDYPPHSRPSKSSARRDQTYRQCKDCTVTCVNFYNARRADDPLPDSYPLYVIVSALNYDVRAFIERMDKAATTLNSLLENRYRTYRHFSGGFLT